MKKKTLVLGAHPDASRYAFIASERLQRHGHEVVPVGIRQGKCAGLDIIQGKPALENIDTITLYINPDIQVGYYDYILGLKPKRIIFNPGTENSSLVKLAKAAGIETDYACTLVMLASGQY
jgi:predicted CoA-binding protein